MVSALMPAFAESASADFSILLPEFVKVESVFSPVLIANITDRTGNLYAPLCSKFKVITNSSETKKLYLKANTVTDAGQENAMFEQGGQVYIAFANLAKIPKSQALAYVRDKYEVFVKNGTSYVTVNIGSNVLKNSFAANDSKGFYQTILSLTEADI